MYCLVDFVRKQQKKRKQKDLEDDYTIQITKDTYAHLFRSQKPWRYKQTNLNQIFLKIVYY